MSKLDFVWNFTKMLADYGDIFFTCGDTSKDYSVITGTIESQGYWCGVKVRYYFDKEYNLLHTEERKFGI